MHKLNYKLNYHQLAKDARAMKFQEFKERHPKECKLLRNGEKYGLYHHYIVLRGFGSRDGIVEGKKAAYAFKYMKEQGFGEEVAIPVLQGFLEQYAERRYRRVEQLEGLLGVELFLPQPQDFASEIILDLYSCDVPESSQRRILYLMIKNKADAKILNYIKNGILEKTGYISDKELHEIFRGTVLNKQEFIREIAEDNLSRQTTTFVEQVYKQIKIEGRGLFSSLIKRYIEGDEISGEILVEILACRSQDDGMTFFPEQRGMAEDRIEKIFDSALTNERNRKIARMYFIEGMSLVDIGKIFGLSRERIRQIISYIKNRVRERVGEG